MYKLSKAEYIVGNESWLSDSFRSVYKLYPLISIEFVFKLVVFRFLFCFYFQVPSPSGIKVVQPDL
jgi:hypothetical protein